MADATVRTELQELVVLVLATLGALFAAALLRPARTGLLGWFADLLAYLFLANFLALIFLTILCTVERELFGTVVDGVKILDQILDIDAMTICHCGLRKLRTSAQTFWDWRAAHHFKGTALYIGERDPPLSFLPVSYKYVHWTTKTATCDVRISITS